MNISLKQLEAFIWVSDLGSFRRAAERLNTTQPNISSRISSLEGALSIKLMERDAGSVRLNDKGYELLPQARKILQATESFIEAAGQSKRMTGVIKLGVTEMIVNTWLRDFMKQVKDQFPNLNIELMIDLSDNLRPRLFSRDIDLVFQNGPFSRKTTGAIDLGTYPFVWVSSPQLKPPSSNDVDLEFMKKQTILTHARGTRPFEEIDAHFKQIKGKPAALIPSSSIGPSRHMAIDGLGIACLPASMVHHDVRNGKLVEIKYPWVPTSLQFLARYDAETSSSLVEKVARLAQEISLKYPKTLN